MFIPAGFTTNTHNITAHYELLDDSLELGAQPVDTNGDTLEEVTADLINFFNNSEETAEHFVAYTVTYLGDYADVELRGEFYMEDGEGEYTEDTVVVKVIIKAEEK